MIYAIGDWVAIEPRKEESLSGILSSSMDEGTVLSGLELEGKVVLFDINKVACKKSEYWIIHRDNVYGVVE